jgi:hypothetical protein
MPEAIDQRLTPLISAARPPLHASAVSPADAGLLCGRKLVANSLVMVN